MLVREELLEDEVANVARQERLRSARASRVPSEPKIEEDHVIVLVRHVAQGVVSRMFLKRTTTMAQVYDWIGSLQLVPEYFQLLSPVSGLVLLPEEPVTHAANCVLNMCEVEDPLSLVHGDSEINAFGFAETFLEDTSANFPENFMEGDKEDMDAENVSNLLLDFIVLLCCLTSDHFIICPLNPFTRVNGPWCTTLIIIYLTAYLYLICYLVSLSLQLA